MQSCDDIFTYMKKNESNDQIMSMVETLKRNKDKKVELYSKLNELNNLIDNLQNRYVASRMEIIDQMEMVSKIRSSNRRERRESTEIKSEHSEKEKE